MAKPSRDKGKRGELEVAHLFTDNGLPARRTAQMQAGVWSDDEGACEHADVTAVLAPDLFVEVKRQETLRLPAWTRKAEADCPEGRTPIVAYRQNRQPWRGSLDLAWLARELAELRHYRREMERAEQAEAVGLFHYPQPWERRS